MARRDRALALTTTLVAVSALGTPTPAAAEVCPRVLSSTIETTVLHAGDGTRQTLVLEQPAPPGGTLVVLSGGNVGYRASSDQGVRFAEGQRRLVLPVRFTGGTGGAYTWRDMTASTDCSRVPTTPVTVRPLDPAVLAVQSVVFRARVALPGTTVVARITLTAPARPTGTSLALYGGGSGSERAIDHEPIATVPAGALSVDLPVRTRDVLVDPRPDLVSAQLSSDWASGDVLVLPRGLYVSATFPAGRTSSRQRVGLGRRAPAGGAVVQLRDTRSDLSYPSSVTVPEGAYTATFVVRTPTPRGTGSVTATWAGQSTTRQITFEQAAR